MAITVKHQEKSIEVNEVDTTQVNINGKEVRKDMNGNWVSNEELTRAEYIAFKKWKKSVDA